MTETVGRSISEVIGPGDVPIWRQPEWQQRFPWLLQGTTGRGNEAEPFDLGLFGDQPVGAALARWDRLREWAEVPRVVHARQVHGTELRAHGPAAESGLLVGHGHDGHLTREPGVLLTVAVADCIPVFVVDARARAVALVHAGWRGVAGGIVEAAISRLLCWDPRGEQELWLHCGPAICGRCYEVGPEVHAAVHPDRPPPSEAQPIDLHAAVAGRAAGAGVAPERVSRSEHCTRCGGGEFFSHRGGSPARQMGVLGVRS